jgi:hypothetical protein
MHSEELGLSISLIPLSGWQDSGMPRCAELKGKCSVFYIKTWINHVYIFTEICRDSGHPITSSKIRKLKRGSIAKGYGVS